MPVRIKKKTILTFVVHKVLVIRPVLGFLDVKLPAFHIDFHEHLDWDSQRFLLDLTGEKTMIQ